MDIVLVTPYSRTTARRCHARIRAAALLTLATGAILLLQLLRRPVWMRDECKRVEDELVMHDNLKFHSARPAWPRNGLNVLLEFSKVGFKAWPHNKLACKFRGDPLRDGSDPLSINLGHKPTNKGTAQKHDKNMRILHGNDFSTLHKHLVRFGFSNSAFYEVRMCTAGVDHYLVSLTTFARGRHY